MLRGARGVNTWLLLSQRSLSFGTLTAGRNATARCMQMCACFPLARLKTGMPRQADIGSSKWEQISTSCSADACSPGDVQREPGLVWTAWSQIHFTAIRPHGPCQASTDALAHPLLLLQIPEFECRYLYLCVHVKDTSSLQIHHAVVEYLRRRLLFRVSGKEDVATCACSNKISDQQFAGKQGHGKTCVIAFEAVFELAKFLRLSDSDGGRLFVVKKLLSFVVLSDSSRSYACCASSSLWTQAVYPPGP